MIALVAAVVLYATLSVMQNLPRPPEDQVGRKPQGGEVAKFMLLAEHVLGSAASGQFGPLAAQQFDQPEMHPADRLQAVLVLGETESDAAALQRLEAIRAGTEAGSGAGAAPSADEVGETPPSRRWAMVKGTEGWSVDGQVVDDAAAMESLYRDGVGGLSDEQRSRLRDRYGWLGELALTHGEAPDSPQRAALFRDAPWALVLIGLVALLMLAGFFGGLTMFIIATVMFFSGRLVRRFVPPAPGGSVYLETFAIFLLAFGVLHVSAGIIAGIMPDANWLEPAVLIAQWCLLLTIFWPCLRGVSFGAWRDAVGWRAPQGVLREVFAGVAGYFACLPLFLAAIGFTLWLNLEVAKFTGGPDAPPSNPVVDMVKNSGPLGLVLFLTLATMWAPIVEETIFRASVFRHLRGRMGAFLAATITAFLFAFMHSYGPLMTAPLIALGFSFAMIREWRGSLIGSMTAHCLHNATIMVIMLIGLKVMM